MQQRQRSMPTLIRAVLCFAAALVIASCQGPEPGKNADLVPTPGGAIPGPPGFCKTDAQGRLLINVTNGGSVPAPASVTVVTFDPGGNVEIPTPSVAVGSSVTLPVQIPAACFNPDCDFRITVDSKGTVSEGNETNNTAGGSCLG